MNTNYHDNSAKPVTLPVFAITRHRLQTDGIGVTTLVGAYGCPLSCKYCINPHAWDPSTLGKCISMTPDDLYEKTRIDNLYFLATGGGITFGGGEALLHSKFIRAFRSVCGAGWTLGVETSLNVPVQNLLDVLDVVNDYIIDIKDMNPDIYQSYTGRDNEQVLQNLRTLIRHVSPEHIIIRIPRIPDFNNQKDIESSIKALRETGFQNFDVFPYIIRKY